jgi:prepilin-type N-terminal cleavage/methylation domain-containing protein
MTVASTTLMKPFASCRSSRRRGVSGFTLVELLVVIAIIGILAAIAIPAITGAVRTSREAAIRVEIDVIGQALEAYKLQYGDYPPDFSDWSAIERHFRKAFPSIDDKELKLLAQFTWLDSNFSRVPLTMSDLDPRTSPATYAYYRQCIDPAEALVFCLGGFSSDKKKPFTGQGGPFALIGTPGMGVTASYGLYQYNTERSNGLMELKSDQLSIFVANDPTAASSVNPTGATSPYTYSNDEYVATVSGTSLADSYSTRGSGSLFAGIHFLVDPFPVYTVNENAGPVAYFNSSGYTRTFAPSTVTGGWVTATNLFHALNLYFPSSGDAENGVARPYLLNQANTTAGGFMWAEQSKFQLISAGLDGSFGGSAAAGVASATAPNDAGQVTIYPTGQFANAAGALVGADTEKYEDPESIYGNLKPQLDNITNFSTRTLEGDIP